MSTYWYYECTGHEPPIRSEAEFTQHTDDRHYHTGLWLIGKRPVAQDKSYYRDPDFGRTDEERSDAYFRMNATGFLTHHPTCPIRAVNEYGIYADEETR